MMLLAAASFVGIFFLKGPFPVIVLSAGLIGLADSVILPEYFLILKEKEAGELDRGYVRICEDQDY